MGNALGKHVISLYATKISQVGKIKDIKKLQQNTVREGSEGREGRKKGRKEGRKEGRNEGRNEGRKEGRSLFLNFSTKFQW